MADDFICRRGGIETIGANGWRSKDHEAATGHGGNREKDRARRNWAIDLHVDLRVNG